jgi:hypothetical protein
LVENKVYRTIHFSSYSNSKVLCLILVLGSLKPSLYSLRKERGTTEIFLLLFFLGSANKSLQFKIVETEKLRAEWPDWANFHLLGDCLLCAGFLKYLQYVQYSFCAVFSLLKSYVLIFYEKWVWLHFRWLFHKLIWSHSLRGKKWRKSFFQENFLHFAWKLFLLSKPVAVQDYQQGCQMVYFQTKYPNVSKFWRVKQWKMSVYFMAIWYILWPFGIFYDHLVYVMAFWYILWPFGIFYGLLVYFRAVWYFSGHLVYFPRFLYVVAR